MKKSFLSCYWRKILESLRTGSGLNYFSCQPDNLSTPAQTTWTHSVDQKFILCWWRLIPLMTHWKPKNKEKIISMFLSIIVRWNRCSWFYFYFWCVNSCFRNIKIVGSLLTTGKMFELRNWTFNLVLILIHSTKL